mmetsp:Transcript_38421/g.108579  ORF Transcript_38421/g.108579 Transcript_38421/m.108579 type:complete len:107 (+) Transcript_38421:533-853(+)|eukprot:CAMPEP_0117661568 /NCGR_PEP_ID=MMETSP0804-20121206/7606_1 /TAXON_ID=1074897 /ORGANISM="Tetraselmis astigmatica, Strain CCMP880" /LENGTH=106 /DNA_ID=CAMNT_0005468443 /DNA_START=489 /DNA_END=809 /DNA_ORIENTATION=-
MSEGKTPADIEREQEEMLRKKYPGMGLGRGRGRGHASIAKDHKYFDSADWQLQKDAALKGHAPPPMEEKADALPAKLKPSPPPSRRVSHLDSMETSRDMRPMDPVP